MKKQRLPKTLHAILLRAFLFFALFGGVNAAQGQIIDWGSYFTGGLIGPSSANHIHTDALGNTYFASNFNGIQTIGSQTVTSPSGFSPFLAKYDQNGSLIWLKSFPHSTYEVADITDMETDAAGNIYLLGTYIANIQFDSFVLTGTGQAFNPSFFLAKLNASGQTIWATNGLGIGSSFQLDAGGNIYLSGLCPAAFIYNGQTIPGTDPTFLIKTNNSGQLLWSKRLDTFGFKVTVGANGNGAILGSFPNPTLDLGNGFVLTSIIQNQGFVAGFSAAGQVQWANVIDENNITFSPHDIKTNASGEFYVMASYSFGVIYAGTTLAGVTGGTAALGTDICVIKIDGSGSLIWMKRIGLLGYQYFFGAPAFAPFMEIDDEGNFIVGNTHDGTVELTDSTLVYPYDYLTNEITFAKYNSSGDLLWGTTIGGVDDHTLTGLALSPAGEVVLGGMILPVTGTLPTYFSGSNFSIPAQTNSVLFITQFRGDANKIKGTVFLDNNYSGTQDSNEQSIEDLPVSISSDLSAFTGNNGVFVSYADSGNFQVTPAQIPQHYAVNPVVHTANFTGYSQTDSLNNFALQPTGTVQDLQVSMVQLSAARPGFTYRNRITYRNVGTIPVSGTLQFLADSLLGFQNSLPAATTTSGDTLSWSFTDLQPFETHQITVEWLVPATANLGTPIQLFALAGPISTDQTPADNSFSDSTVVIGSYDPNDKLVSHTQLSPTQISHRQPLTYTIRFQNTGTDTAFAVMVRDELSDLVDLNTIEVLSASHTFTAEITGPHTIQWKFSNILLPDSNTNEAASHGYIQYRIKPLATLSAGQHINTSAGIYFDFNAPVLTNITDTEVVLPSAVAPAVPTLKVNLYPNPSSGTSLVEIPASATAGVKLTLRNALGQEVFSQSLHSAGNVFRQELNLKHLPAGIYLLQVQHANRSTTKHLVLQR